MPTFPLQAKVNADIKVDLTPVSQAFANLVNSPQKGVGKIFRAVIGPWIADRERSIRLSQAQTEKDCEDIKNGAKLYREEKLVNPPNSAEPGSACDVLQTLNHMSDARRLQAAVEEALRQISDVPPEEISDEPLSQTFFNRWRREAEMVDEDDLRQFWARLLVEETKKPKSISFGTLDVARNLTHDDAVVFQRLCRGVVGNALVVGSKQNPINGTYSDLLALQDAGLLNSQKSSVKIASNSEHAAEFFTPLQLAICSGTKELQYYCHILTRAGLEIMKTVSVERTQEDVIGIAKLMSEHDSRPMVFVFKTEKTRQADGRETYGVLLDSPVWSSVGIV